MTINDLTNRVIQIACDERVLNQLMIQCLELIRPQIPAVGRSALQTAKKYWIQDCSSPAHLEEARVECWKFLDQESASTNTEKVEYCALRAVLCVLYAETAREEFVDTVDWFFQMLFDARKDEDQESFAAIVDSAIEKFRPLD